MSGVNDMILFLAAMGVSVLACAAMWFRHVRTCGRGGSRDELYDRIVLSGIRLRDGGVPVDEVVANLSGEDMSGFHL